MIATDVTEERVGDVLSKLETGVRLDPDDIVFLFFNESVVSEYRDTGNYRDEIDNAITGGVGHGAYIELLRRLENVGVLDEIRQDLVHPLLHPKGFERVRGNGRIYYLNETIGENASEGVGYVNSPIKRPTTLGGLRTALLNYMSCVGKGFSLDSEMMYDYETDYREFVRVTLDCTALDEYRLTVDVDEGTRSSTVHVSLSVGGRSYSEEFQQRSDWADFDALNPVHEALDDQTAQTIHYRSGNAGWLLVLEDRHGEFVEYLS